MNVSRILLTITLLGYFGFSKAQIYQDKDNDGYGTGIPYLLPPPDGYNYVTQNGDCNDNNRSINPGRSESFDGIDNNCKNGVDEGFAIPRPTAPTISKYCGITRLTRGNSPYSFVTWHWQSSPTGTNTSTGVANNSTSTYKEFTSGSVYYLRARHTPTGRWSTARTINYSINTVPSRPAPPSVSNQCGNTVLTRGTPPSGITWYWQSSSSGTSTSNSASSISRTSGSVFYLRARNNSSGCWGPARAVSYSIKALPPRPSASTVVSNNCGNSVLTRGTPPSGITWYWQGSRSGTSTSNSSRSITRTSGTVYYLRARSNGTGCWSPARAVSYSIKALPPKPSAPSVSNNCGSSVLTRGTPPSGITWYWQSSATGTSTSNSSASVTRTSGTTYYLRARNNTSLCWGATRTVNYGITQPTTWYADSDGDGYGNASVTLSACTIPPNYVSNNNDYDDTTIHITNIAPHYFYQDSDGDGFGDPNVSVYYSVMPSGYVIDNTDQCPNKAGPYNGCTYVPVTLSDENYVYTGVYQVPMSDESERNEDSDVIESVTYFDGLGRAKQSIEIKAAPDKKDIITHREYDDYGRQEKEWLPYHEPTGSLGSYRGDRSSATQSYYKANYADDFSTLDIPNVNAYVQKGFEASPLDRVLKQAAPGYDWRMGGGHEVEFWNVTNGTNEVRKYRVTTTLVNNTYMPSLVADGHYAPGELYKNIVRDENHAGSTKLHTTEEFTDKQGRVILKRAYADLSPLGGDTEGAHDTYYVYDGYGNLTYTLPPKVDTSDGVSASELVELCYQYVYDHRNRLVEKKQPGKGWEYIVYDKLDRPIMTQDANLDAQDKWLFTKYDAHGRVAYTGMVGSTGNRASLQTGANSATAQYESRGTSSPSLADENVLYSNSAYPNTLSMEILTVNYYDSYADTDGLSVPTTVLGQTKATNTKGLATVSKVRVLDPSATAGEADWITTITGYDEKGRAIHTASKNTYLNTTDIVETELDFVGRSLKVRSAHTRTLDGIEETIVTIDNFAYDHVGRLLNQTQCIGDATLGDTCNSTIGGTSLVFSTPVTGSRTDIAASSITLRPGFHVVAAPGLSYTAKIDPQFAQEPIVYNNYDELGQLVRKKVGGGSTGSPTALQDVEYTYNVRGWLTSINDPSNLGDDLFAFGINYNTVAHSGTKLYNGNIAETEWRTANTDSSLKWYRYGYDALNRLTSATANSVNYSVSGISYDKMGNIQTLTRKGHTNSGATSFGTMDDLVYTYDSGNKLTKVLDNGNDTYGFTDSSANNQDYWYDGNGNMVRDLNKGIGTASVDGIGYNHLNLPEEVKFDNSSTKKITYIYDALGTKLKKMTNNNGSLTTTDYAGNYVYEDGNLRQFSHPEGYVEPDGSGGYTYVYNYKDQVQNVRLSYADLDGNGSINPSTEILHERSYYPFGLLHKGYNNQINGVINNHKQYQDQEFTEDLGLNVHEWKYRFSDPAIGRFWSIDPLADDYRYQSPYNFSENRVIDGVELEGLEYVTIHHIMNGSTHISTTSTDYYRMTDREINAINGTPAGAYNAASYGPKGKGVKHITHDISNNTTTERWDNRRVDFASRAGNHGLYSGAGSITGYGGDKDYAFGYQPVDWSDAIAKRHDKDYEDARIKAEASGGISADFIDDVNTYQADLDMLDRLDTYTSGGNLTGVDTPYRTTTSGEMQLSIKGQKTVIGALAAYKKWKIDNNYGNSKKHSFGNLAQEFYEADMLNAIIIGLIYDNKEN